MKKSLFITFAFLSLCGYSQVKTYNISEKQAVSNETLGVDNFLGGNVQEYKNTELYLPEQTKDVFGDEPCGYNGFVIDINKDKYDKSNIYKKVKCKSYGDYSSHDDLKNRYFIVKDVIKSDGNPDFFLKIEDKVNGDTIYYKYNLTSEYSFPFISVPYFENMKKSQLNKIYLSRGRNWQTSSEENIYDMNTGNPVNYSSGNEWSCTDVSIVESSLSLILKNGKNETVHFPIHMIKSHYFLINKVDSEKYKKRFGVANWNKILKGEILRGFTEEMVTLSWGEPNKINKLSSGKQWVYDGQYIYFKNGRVSGFN